MYDKKRSSIVVGNEFYNSSKSLNTHIDNDSNNLLS